MISVSQVPQRSQILNIQLRQCLAIHISSQIHSLCVSSPTMRWVTVTVLLAELSVHAMIGSVRMMFRVACVNDQPNTLIWRTMTCFMQPQSTSDHMWEWLALSVFAVHVENRRDTSERYGLALSTSALWRVSFVCQSGDIKSCVLFTSTIFYYWFTTKKTDEHHPPAKLHLYAKFQSWAFWSFGAIVWREIALWVSQSVSQSPYQLGHLMGS